MDSDPFSADLYIFCNRARTLVKIVAWQGDGFVLWMKRLEKSRFKWPLSGSDSVLKLTVQEINWFASIDDTRAIIDTWRKHYNHVRPHRSLGRKPPAVFANEAASYAQSPTSEVVNFQGYGYLPL